MRERWRDSVTDGETDENKRDKDGELYADYIHVVSSLEQRTGN